MTAQIQTPAAVKTENLESEMHAPKRRPPGAPTDDRGGCRAPSADDRTA
jgi:hypothetical protein